MPGNLVLRTPLLNFFPLDYRTSIEKEIQIETEFLEAFNKTIQPETYQTTSSQSIDQSIPTDEEYFEEYLENEEYEDYDDYDDSYSFFDNDEDFYDEYETKLSNKKKDFKFVRSDRDKNELKVQEDLKALRYVNACVYNKKEARRCAARTVQPMATPYYYTPPEYCYIDAHVPEVIPANQTNKRKSGHSSHAPRSRQDEEAQLAAAIAASAAESLRTTGLTSHQLQDLLTRDLTPEDYDLLLRLDETVAKKTISKETLSKFKTRTVEEESDLVCMICLDLFEIGQVMKTLPCDHSFHIDCIDKWLSSNSNKCPLDGLVIDS